MSHVDIDADQVFVPWDPVFRSLVTILVVEDDHELCSVYRDAMTYAGYAVIAVKDGLSALRVIDEDRPDTIVLDLDLPPLSGWDLRAEIAAHAETRDIPIL